MLVNVVVKVNKKNNEKKVIAMYKDIEKAITSLRNMKIMVSMVIK